MLEGLTAEAMNTIVASACFPIKTADSETGISEIISADGSLFNNKYVLKPEFIINFSKPVKSYEMLKNSLVVRSQSGYVTYRLVLSEDKKRAELSFDDYLANGETYSILLANTITDTENVTIKPFEKLDFETCQLLNIISSTPAPDAVEVATDTSISVTFDERISCQGELKSIFVLKDSENNIASATVKISDDHKSIVLTPEKPLLHNMKYTVSLIDKGICGYTEADSEFIGCNNLGNITGIRMVGGIVGECYDNCTFDHCFNKGRITSEESGSGIVDYAEVAHIMCCYNEGETDCGGDGGSGGISSCLMGSDLSNCYNTGDIYACKVFDGTDVGGIVGYAQDSNVSNCYVDCTVSDDKEYSMIVSSVYGGSFVDCFATERSVKICNGVSAPVEYPSQILDPIHLANGTIFKGFNVLNLGTSSAIAGAPYWETTGWNDTSIWTLYSDKPPTLVP